MNNPVIYILFLLFFVAVVAIIMVLLIKNKQKKTLIEGSESASSEHYEPFEVNVIEFPKISQQSVDLVPNLELERVSRDLFKSNKHSLTKVTNSTTLARLDSLIQLKDPAMNLANVVKSVNESGELFRVVLHKGGELAQRGNGNFFGFAMEAGKFTEQAELIKQAPELAQTIGNAVNAGMNIASMVVGQYYMSEINDKLKSIDSKLSQISQFQENEKIAELIGIGDEIHTMSSFSSDIFENADRKTARLHQIQNLRQQVNTLNIFANKQFMDTVSNFEVKGDFNEMKKLLSSLEVWNDMRVVSAGFLDEILKLEIIFSADGSISKDEILAQRSKATDRTTEASAVLEKFSKDYVVKYGEKWRKKCFNKLDENRYHKSVYVPLSNILSNEIVPSAAIENTLKAIGGPTELIIDEDGEIYYTVTNEGEDNG
jgi:purine-nucleoside phosphorylase